MLDLIRRQQKSVIIKVVFWAIIATFVGTIFLVWGKGGDGTKQQGGNVAVTVGKTEVGFDEFQTAYQNIYRFYQNIYRDQLTPQLEKQLRLQQQALDMLVEQALMLEEAKRLGVKVSDQEVIDAISKIPAFQENGAFSKARYLQVLAYQRLTPDAFEAMQKRELLVEKARTQMAGEISVGDAEVADEYARQNDKVDLSFVRLVPARFEGEVRVDGAGLAAFFASRREEFRLPEALALDYLLLDPSRYEAQASFDDTELDKYYRRHLDRFEIPEQVKVAHILVRVPQGADETLRQQKRARAEELLKQAKAGKDFAALARSSSEDPGSAARGGDLGFFPRGAMVPPFEQAAFALKPGEVSELVTTDFGFHILKGEGHIEGRVKPLAEVLDEVKAGLRREKALQIAMDKAMDAYNVNRKGGSLATAAKALGAEVRQGAFFTRGEAVEGLEAAPQIAEAAFALRQGDLGRPVELGDSVLLYAVRARRDSRLPELGEVRAEVEQAYRQEKAKELARREGERLLAGVRAGQPLPALVRPPLTVETTGEFTRAGGAFVPRIGSSEALSQAAFALTAAAPAAKEVFEVDGNFIATVLKSRQSASPTSLDPAKHEEIRKAVLARKQQEAADKRLKELREQTKIVYAPTLNIEEEAKESTPSTKEAKQ